MKLLNILLIVTTAVIAGEVELVQLVEQYESVLKSYSELLKKEQLSTELNCDSSCLEKDNYACGGFVNPSDISLTSGFGIGDGCANCTDANRKLNTKAGTFLTVKKLTQKVDSAVVGDTCLSYQALEKQFVTDGSADIAANSPKKWRYVGMPSGIFRQYPGILSRECEKYDPRIRPWYIAATSGPKDVVFILDISGSMSEDGRMELLKGAMNSVLSTLSANDYFNIIVFSDSASFLNPSTSYLIQGTSDNVERMKKLVAQLKPEGSTNMVSAFAKALEGFKNKNPSPEVASSANCRKAALFLTDGKPNADQTPEQVKAAAAALGAEGITIFTYSLGDGADHQTTKDIACTSGGLWSAVSDGGNLRDQMANYYQFFEIQKASGVSSPVWAEPYEDANGLGIVTTAALAVYDESRTPPVLIGVVGMDLKIDDLSKMESDYEKLLKFLVRRSNVCPAVVNLSSAERTCLLESLRTRSESRSRGPFGAITGIPSSTCQSADMCAASKITTLDSTRQQTCKQVDNFKYPQLITSDRAPYICGDKCSAGLGTGGYIGIGVGAAVLLGLIIGTILYFKKRRNAKASSVPVVVNNLNNIGNQTTFGSSYNPANYTTPSQMQNGQAQFQSLGNSSYGQAPSSYSPSASPHFPPASPVINNATYASAYGQPTQYPTSSPGSNAYSVGNQGSNYGTNNYQGSSNMQQAPADYASPSVPAYSAGDYYQQNQQNPSTNYETKY